MFDLGVLFVFLGGYLTSLFLFVWAFCLFGICLRCGLGCYGLLCGFWFTSLLLLWWLVSLIVGVYLFYVLAIWALNYKHCIYCYYVVLFGGFEFVFGT